MKAPVSVCLICRDDEKTLEQCLLSFKDFVEEVIVVDTGSKDSSPEIAKKHATKFEIYTDCNNPETGLIENFSQARNKSFELATQPWVMWVDADDIISGAENLLELTKKEGNICYYFPYEYSYDANGKCNCFLYRERLAKNKNLYTWKSPVHEVLVPLNSFLMKSENSDKLVFKHQRQYHSKPKESSRNLRIIEKFVKENGGDSDPRQLYYLGLEYFNNAFFDKSYETLEKYVKVTGWDDEKCMALLKLVEICILRKDYEKGLDWSFKSLQVKENWGECYFAIAKIYYYLAGKNDSKKEWERCAYFAKLGLALPPTKTLLFFNSLERDYDIYLYLNVALSKLGLFEEALEAVNKGLSVVPDSGFLLHNKKFYETNIAKSAFSKSINDLKNLKEISEEVSDIVLDLVNNKNSEYYLQLKKNLKT